MEKPRRPVRRPSQRSLPMLGNLAFVAMLAALVWTGKLDVETFISIAVPATLGTAALSSAVRRKR